ncbi:MAG: thermonuclease family protein [Candidatus Thermoplasmatota archaeon]|nr:thermonuclease family protein [Candidatus Thermoplasmatota archaeon]
MGQIRHQIVLLAVVTFVVVSMIISVIPAPEPQEHGGAGENIEGEVTRIVDGDTLYIDDVKIRLALVDAPEYGETGYDEAKDFAADICPEGSQATADQDDWQLEDEYGRMIAVVYCGGKNLNYELLKSGHAVILTQYCAVSEFGDETWAVEYGC